MDLCTIVCGLYLAGGVARMHAVGPPPPNDLGHNAWVHDITRPMNPYGILEVGWQSPTWQRLDLSLAARHMSGSGTDHGIDTMEMRVRWMPFARRTD